MIMTKLRKPTGSIGESGKKCLCHCLTRYAHILLPECFIYYQLLSHDREASVCLHPNIVSFHSGPFMVA